MQTHIKLQEVMYIKRKTTETKTSARISEKLHDMLNCVSVKLRKGKESIIRSGPNKEYSDLDFCDHTAVYIFS